MNTPSWPSKFRVLTTQKDIGDGMVRITSYYSITTNAEMSKTAARDLPSGFLDHDQDRYVDTLFYSEARRELSKLRRTLTQSGCPEETLKQLEAVFAALKPALPAQ